MTGWESFSPGDIGSVAPDAHSSERQYGDVVNGRYWLPDPVTGKPGMRTRVTTFAERLEDMWALNAWEKRVTLYGLTTREDLYVKACGTELADTKGLDSILRDAKEAGGGSVGANIGTGIHGLFNAHDAGLPSRAPVKYARKVQLYAEALERNRLAIAPSLAERLVFIDEYNLSGRMDGVVVESGRDDFTVIDYKSQKKWHSWGKVAIQLACYSRATAMWAAERGEWEEMPKMRLDRALVFWVPIVGSDPDSPSPDFVEVIEVDTQRAWEHAAPLSDMVRQWQNEGKRKGALSSPYVPGPRPIEAYAALLLTADSVDDIHKIHAEAADLGFWCEELQQTAAVAYDRCTFVRGKGYV